MIDFISRIELHNKDTKRHSRNQRPKNLTQRRKGAKKRGIKNPRDIYRFARGVVQSRVAATNAWGPVRLLITDY